MTPGELAADLARLEQQYGDGQRRVQRRRISDLDPRRVEGAKGRMLSGARFIKGTGYAQVYAERFAPLVNNRVVLVELGTLLGVGVAVWCDVFPNGRIIGLDIDQRCLSLRTLRDRGAFQFNSPALHFLDELQPDAHKRMARILRGERIDILIDDALHDDASILIAMRAVLPLMAKSFLYFVEDNSTVHEAIREAYPRLHVENRGRLTVITNG